MKKFISYLLTSGIFTLNMIPLKADYDYFGIKRPMADDVISATAIELFTIDSTTGTATSVTKKCFDREYYDHIGIWVCGGMSFSVNENTGHFEVSVNDGTQSYNPLTDTWTLTTPSQKSSNNSWKGSYEGLMKYQKLQKMLLVYLELVREIEPL